MGTLKTHVLIDCEVSQFVIDYCICHFPNLQKIVFFIADNDMENANDYNKLKTHNWHLISMKPPLGYLDDHFNLYKQEFPDIQVVHLTYRVLEAYKDFLFNY